jgi:transcriptional regulator GlxA family with amidase domain
LAAPEASPLVVFRLNDVLVSVGAVHSDMTTGVPGKALLDVKIVAADREPFRSFGGVLIEPHAGIDDVDRVYVVIVCDLYSLIYDAPHGKYAREIVFLRRMHAQGAMITSVCAGTLL